MIWICSVVVVALIGLLALYAPLLCTRHSEVWVHKMFLRVSYAHIY